MVKEKANLIEQINELCQSNDEYSELRKNTIKTPKNKNHNKKKTKSENLFTSNFNDYFFSMKSVREQLEKLLSLYALYSPMDFYPDDENCDEDEYMKELLDKYTPYLYKRFLEESEIVYDFEGSAPNNYDISMRTDNSFLFYPYMPAYCLSRITTYTSKYEEIKCNQYNEVWLLKNGKIAAVTCIHNVIDGYDVKYRYIDHYIETRNDLTIPFYELIVDLEKL